MVPDFQSAMLPLLECLKDGAELSIDQIQEALAHHFELTDAERNQRLPGSDQPLFQQAVQAARLHLLQADLLSCTTPDRLTITPLGKQVLGRRLNKIDTNYLNRLPGYRTKD